MMIPTVLADATDDIGPGATAFFIVCALIVAALVIFWALFGSLRRLKKSVAEGAFDPPKNAAAEQATVDARAASDRSPAATPDPGGSPSQPDEGA